MNSTITNKSNTQQSYFDQPSIINKITTLISNLRSELISYTDKSYNILIKELIKLSQLINDSIPYCHTKTSNWVEDVPKGLLSIDQDDIKLIQSSFLEITTIFTTYTDILLSTENKSIIISLTLLIHFTQCKRIFPKDILGDISYKIVHLCSMRFDLYNINKKTIDNIVASSKDNIILQRKYFIMKESKKAMMMNEQKSIIINDDISISHISYCNDNDNYNNDMSYTEIMNNELQTFLPFDNKSRSIIKEVINHPEQLFNFFSQLEHESDVFNQYLNTEANPKVINLFSSFTHLHHKYLYIIKKVIDQLDSDTSNICNKTLKERLINIIFRSKTVISYIMENIHISYDYLYYSNKEIYIERYIHIGSFLYKRINFTKKSTYLQIKAISDKIVSDLINNIKDFYNREKIELHNDSLIPSMYHSIIFPLMYYSEDNSNCNTLGITCDIETEDILKKLAYFIKSERRVTSLDPKLPFIMFNYEIIKGHCVQILIENERQLLKLRSLSSFIFQKSKMIFLYVNIKSWAEGRKLFIDRQFVDNANRIFDDCLLMYFVGLYLVHIGEIEPYDNEKDAYTFNEDKYLFDNDYQKINNSVLGYIGELFVNFFYFVVNITKKIKQLSQIGKVLVVDLKEKEISEEEVEYSKYDDYQEKKALYLKHFNQESEQETFYYEYDIVKIIHLEKEAYRMLHYLLEEHMMKISFAYINKIN